MEQFKYTWNPETISHFQFMSSYLKRSEVKEIVEDFVEIDCTLENGETEEELIKDLLNQIYTK